MSGWRLTFHVSFIQSSLGPQEDAVGYDAGGHSVPICRIRIGDVLAGDLSHPDADGLFRRLCIHLPGPVGTDHHAAVCDADLFRLDPVSGLQRGVGELCDLRYIQCLPGEKHALSHRAHPGKSSSL